MSNKFVTIGLSVLAVIAVIVIGIFIVQGSQNKAISYEEQISTAQSDINVQEKRRGDLIPNLVDCVKEYDKHEYETLMAVIEARQSGNGNMSDADVNEIQSMISVVAEAYPELKSNSNYQQLMTELSTTENLIATYRSNYNKCVKDYNQYVRKFPARLFLSMSGYEVLNFEYLEYETSHDAPTNLFG